MPQSTHRIPFPADDNFETNRLKVNDSDGNPVDIAAIVVWQVGDTARATYAAARLNSGPLAPPGLTGRSPAGADSYAGLTRRRRSAGRSPAG